VIIVVNVFIGIVDNIYTVYVILEFVSKVGIVENVI
jgi:hypothetical protein